MKKIILADNILTRRQCCVHGDLGEMPLLSPVGWMCIGDKWEFISMKHRYRQSEPYTIPDDSYKVFVWNIIFPLW